MLNKTTLCSSIQSIVMKFQSYRQRHKSQQRRKRKSAQVEKRPGSTTEDRTHNAAVPRMASQTRRDQCPLYFRHVSTQAHMIQRIALPPLQPSNATKACLSPFDSISCVKCVEQWALRTKVKKPCLRHSQRLVIGMNNSIQFNLFIQLQFITCHFKAL